MSRGVAHANSRTGKESDVAVLRAYNHAIALAPMDIDHNRLATMLSYRSAIFKTLGRSNEAKLDAQIALSSATTNNAIRDVHYNMLCVYAMTRKRDKMLHELKFPQYSNPY